LLGGVLGTATLAAGEAAAAAPRLRVSGRVLTYGARTLRLRGLAVGDPLLARFNRPVSDFAHIAAAWNGNVVRLSVHPSAWKRQRSAALGKLDRDVRGALAARLFVIIDWHTIGWPDGWYEKPAPDWGDPPDYYDSSMAVARSFWTAMAGRYGGDGRIAFELWNEPIYHPDKPGDPAKRWAALKPHWRALLDIIRRHGKNLVLVSGDQWAYDLRGVRQNPMHDDNVAYAWHVYAGHDGNDPVSWARKLDRLNESHPVLVTEWGFGRFPGEHYNGTAASFGNRFRDQFLEGRRLHDTAWCWHPDWGPPMLKPDWRSPNAYGSFVKSRLNGFPEPVRP
jgi:hypothetical protein